MHYADYKSILSPQNGMNLYRGCSHGCIYCDSRSRCYHLDHDFEDIEVKRNAVAILEDQLRRRRKPGMIHTGSMSDPYNALEDSLQLTRQCLQLIETYGYGVTVLTKSTRLLRDLDLFRAIHAKTRCVVQMTLTTFDEDLCRVLEPHVSTTRQRFEALCTLRDAGIPTAVWLGPTLPFINDTRENLAGLLQIMEEAGVSAVVNFGFGMTLREGNREYFYDRLDRFFPGLKQRYIETFGDSYGCSSPRQPALKTDLRAFSERTGIPVQGSAVMKWLHEFPDPQLSLFSP